MCVSNDVLGKFGLRDEERKGISLIDMFMVTNY